MLFDKQNMFSEAQAVGTASEASDNYLDMGAAVNLGEQGKLEVYIKISSAAGTTPTLAVSLQVDDNSAFSSATTVFTEAASTLADGVRRFRIPNHNRARYFRLFYTLGGTTPSCVVDAGLLIDGQTNIPFFSAAI